MPHADASTHLVRRWTLQGALPDVDVERVVSSHEASLLADHCAIILLQRTQRRRDRLAAAVFTAWLRVWAVRVHWLP